MPLTKKGRALLKEMSKEYGKRKGAQVFYALENKGNFKGLVKKMKSSK